VLISRDSGGNLTTPSPVIEDAHDRGLVVHGWTFRRENQVLPTNYRSGPDPNAPGDTAGEVRAFLSAGWTASSPTTPISVWPPPITSTTTRTTKTTECARRDSNPRPAD
jgi:hypothetical protein